METRRSYGRLPFTTSPISRTSPPSASGCSKPARRRSVVVFPQPEGPRMEKNSPRRTSSETSSTAFTAPKRLVTWRSSTTGSAAGTAGAAGVVRRSGTPDAQHQRPPRLAPLVGVAPVRAQLGLDLRHRVASLAGHVPRGRRPGTQVAGDLRERPPALEREGRWGELGEGERQVAVAGLDVAPLRRPV